MSAQTKPATALQVPSPAPGPLAVVGSGSTAVAAFAPTSFEGLMQVADMMSRSGPAVPKHLRNSPGMCLSVAMVAYQNGFNPWLLAADSYVVNDILAYGAKALIAMINNSAQMEGRLHYDLTGAWPNRACTVTGRLRGDDRPKEFTVQAASITTRNSPLWKQQPDQQLIYFSARAWARLYMPEVLLGLMDTDEAVDRTSQQLADHGHGAAVARPTRAAQEQTAEESHIIDAEAETLPDTLEWVSADGDVTELSPTDWVDCWLAAIAAATDGDILVGLWDSNSGQLQRLRDLGFEAPAEEIATAHTAKADALAATERQKREKQQAYINNCLKEIEGCQSVEALDRWQDERATALRRMSDLQYAPVGAAIESRMAFLREQAATE